MKLPEPILYDGDAKVAEREVSLLPKLKLWLVERMQKNGGKKEPYLQIDRNGCWNWMRFKNLGYGVIKLTNPKRTDELVHRFVYELLIEKIQEGLELDHLCRNRGCCNPFHLEPVTSKENILRGIGPTAINSKKTHCKRWHFFDDKNTLKVKNGRMCKRCSLENTKKMRKKLKGFIL